MDIKGIEKLTNKVGKFSWHELKIVKKLIFSQLDDGASVSLEILFDQRKPGFRATLKFLGVTKLQLEEFGGNETRISGFDICDIKDRGWDGIAWEVLDFEDEQIHFFAKTFEILDVVNLE